LPFTEFLLYSGGFRPDLKPSPRIIPEAKLRRNLLTPTPKLLASRTTINESLKLSIPIPWPGAKNPSTKRVKFKILGPRRSDPWYADRRELKAL